MLRDIIKFAGASQKEIAEHLGITVVGLSKIMSGSTRYPKYQTQLKIERLYRDHRAVIVSGKKALVAELRQELRQDGEIPTSE
jgi:transcriptional regulator with XRE-family HTH domain